MKKIALISLCCAALFTACGDDSYSANNNANDEAVDPVLDMDRLLATMKESMWISRKCRRNKHLGMDIPKNKIDRF